MSWEDIEAELHGRRLIKAADPNYVTEQGPMLFFTANAESLNALPSTDPYAEPRILQCPDCSRPVLADNIEHHGGEQAKSLCRR